MTNTPGAERPTPETDAAEWTDQHGRGVGFVHISVSRRIEAERDALVERVKELEQCQPCGHHISLLVKSVESESQFCELCDCRQRRNDAETMEQRFARLCSDADIMATVIRTGYPPPEREWLSDEYRKTALRAVSLHALSDAAGRLDQAALAMAQIINRSTDKHERNAPSVAEWDTARQEVDQARKALRALLREQGDAAREIDAARGGAEIRRRMGEG